MASTISRTGPGSPASIRRRRSALSSGPEIRSSLACTRGRPKSSGLQTSFADRARLDDAHLRRAVERHLVETVAAGHHNGPADRLGPRQDLGHPPGLVFAGNTDELMRGAGRVAERADQVEDRPERKLPPHRRHAAQARDETLVRTGRRCPARRGTAGAPGRFDIDGHAQPLEDVGASRPAGGRTIAVLDDPDAAGGHHDGRRG